MFFAVDHVTPGAGIGQLIAAVGTPSAQGQGKHRKQRGGHHVGDANVGQIGVDPVVNQPKLHKPQRQQHRLQAEYPEVEYSEMFVDNCAMQICKNPAQFDVIVTENMFGDILSDEASEITGSIGMVPSSSLGEGTCGLYEPIHGSAPDIAGQDVVNPIACILSAAMMLRYSFDMPAEADEIEAAVNAVLDEGYRTADMMAEGCIKVGCTEMGDKILENI